MPDRENWTAAMLLHWVLNRDEAAVLTMAERYGVVSVLEDRTVSRLPGADMNEVLFAYCIDPTLPAGEERIAAAVLRSQRVIAAKNEILRALRCGRIAARARRNGAGDVETMTSDLWLGLKFESWDGNDLAIPINVEGVVLGLPWGFEDYLSGRVAPGGFPTVWPNPLFNANQAWRIWPETAKGSMDTTLENAARPVQQVAPGPIDNQEMLAAREPNPPAPPPLSGNALRAELDQWAAQRWGPDFTSLPGRDELLRLALERPGFAKATDKHMRPLRSKYATAASKKGGRPTHASRRIYLDK